MQLRNTLWFSKKRILGLGFILVGVLGVIGIVLLNIMRGATHPEVGPAQKIALAGCVALALMGVTLAVFGVDPDGELEVSEAPATSTESPRGVLWIRRALLGFAAALMLFHLVVFVIYALSLAQFPFDYDQGEGFELNDTVLLSQGQSPYRNNEVYPFYASNYPPLYHVVLIPFEWLFGPQYWYGRLMGFAATLIAAAAIAFAVYRQGRHRLVALLAGLAFIASNYVYHIGPLFRQHIFMVMLETLAVVTIAGINFNEEPRRNRRWLILGLLFLLAAGFTKQLAIVTVAAVFLYLFLNAPRRALVWGVIFGAVAGGLFLLFNIMTGGQWWLHIITGNVIQYIFSQFRGLLSQFIGLHGALLIMALLYIAYELYFDRLSLYTLWFVAAAIDAVLVGKWGAGDSYFTTMIAAMCILAGLFTARCLNRAWKFPAFPSWLRIKPPNFSAAKFVVPAIGLVACGLFVLYGLAVVHIPLDGPFFGPLANALNIKSNTKFANFYDSAGWTMGYATIGQLPSAEDVASGWRIVAAVKDDPRPILSEEAAFSFLTGKPVVTNPTEILTLYLNGHYNPAQLVKMINEQAFGSVIFRASFYPDPVLDAVKHAYKGAQQIDMNGYQYTILLPNPAWKPF